MKHRITAPAGFQAEYHIYLVGLDIEEKAQWTEDQIRESLGEERIKKFSMLKFHVNGSSPIDARNQDVATVDFRVFAQSQDKDLLRMDNPQGFFRLSMVTFLESVPVSHPRPTETTHLTPSGCISRQRHETSRREALL